jgi:NAD(P)-dependent dehydrogenase (short-subunit alcohol dehydrogenase family)
MKDLANKVIVITGAAGLLGSNFSKGFAKYGSRLVLIDALDNVDLVRKELEALGVQAISYVCDISKQDTWKDIASDLSQKNWTADVLINNACCKTPNFFDAFEDFCLDDWNKVFEVNLTACMFGCQTFGAKFASQGSGSIINMASIYGVVAPDQRIYEGSEYLGKKINTPAVYSASKAGLIGLTKHLAAYWGRNNIRVNCVTPGGVFSGQNETFVKNYTDKVPLGRMANAQDIFGAVAFLASDLSSYITGHNLIVDGGWTVW